MSTRTPDRWDRLVLKRLRKASIPGDVACWLTPQEAIALLRTEHLRVVEIVRTERREIVALEAKTRKAGAPQDLVTAECLASRITQCDDILTKLKARAR